MKNPFAQLIGFKLRLGRRGGGTATAALDVRPELLNPNGVVHGGVLFSIADTVMGAALYTTLAPGENCATIEIKIHFLQPVTKGKIRCRTRLVHRGSRVAVLESHISAGRLQVAQALGNIRDIRAAPYAGEERRRRKTPASGTMMVATSATFITSPRISE